MRRQAQSRHRQVRDVREPRSRAREIDVAVLAADAGAVATQAAAIQGVKRVLKVENAANAEPLAAVLAPQVAALAADYTHVFGPSTTFGKDLMPRVAALLGVGQLSDIMAVESRAYKFRRPVYAGNAMITVEAPQDKKLVATVRTASFQAAPHGRQRRRRSRERRLPSCPRTRVSSRAPPRRPVARTCRRRRASFPAVARSAAPKISRSSTASRTSSAPPSAHRVPRSMRATRRTICRSARPARSSRRSCTSRSASPVRFST